MGLSTHYARLFQGGPTVIPPPGIGPAVNNPLVRFCADSLPISSDPVFAWPNIGSGGSMYDASSVVLGVGPTRYANGPNRHAAVRFGQDGFLATASVLPIVGNSARTWVVVSQMPNNERQGAVGNRNIVGYGVNDVLYLQDVLYYGPSTIMHMYNGNVDGPPSPDNFWAVHIFTTEPVGATGRRMFGWYNTTKGLVTNDNGYTGQSKWRIGGGYFGSYNVESLLDLAEARAYTRVLTDAEISVEVQELRNTYGLTS